MREIKIFAILVFFTGVLYYGVEPYAHHQMHPHVEEADYSFEDVEELENLAGNVHNGKRLVKKNCTVCHSIENQGIKLSSSNEALTKSYGVYHLI